MIESLSSNPIYLVSSALLVLGVAWIQHNHGGTKIVAPLLMLQSVGIYGIGAAFGVEPGLRLLVVIAGLPLFVAGIAIVFLGIAVYERFFDPPEPSKWD